MTDHFVLLHNELPALRNIADGTGAEAYFAQEAMRFLSIAGTLKSNFPLDQSASAEERFLTHILARSLIESFFWMVYIFDDPNEKDARYGELLNSFKREYGRMMNEPSIQGAQQLEPAGQGWSQLQPTLDLRSMINRVMNVHGNRLGFVYLIYRVASFDTHGKSVTSILSASFGRLVNFPVLQLERMFDLIANEYCVTLVKILPLPEGSSPSPAEPS